MSRQRVGELHEARALGAALPDPYVTITTDTGEFGNIGPFALADNGLCQVRRLPTLWHPEFELEVRMHEL